MKFKELGGSPVEYGGRSYMTWEVEVEPYHKELFADVALHDAMDAGGSLGNWIDDKIAYYVSPEEEVQDAIEDYKD